MAISDEKMNSETLPVKLNLVLVIRGETLNIHLMTLSDLLNIPTALKFKCYLRAFMKLLYKDRKVYELWI